jgi:hypothetical protein
LIIKACALVTSHNVCVQENICLLYAFEGLVGSSLFLMARESCNASVFDDVDEAIKTLNTTKFEYYVGEYER